METYNRVRELRMKLGLSRQELAKRAGIGPDMLALIEQGKSTPTVYKAIAIARVLGKPVEKIFLIEEEDEA